MKKLKKAMLSLYLYSKRLYGKPSFLVILAAMVLLAALLGGAVKEDAGMLRVAIVDQSGDGAARELLTSLLSEESVVRYRICDHEGAMALLRSGEADLVWILEEELAASLADFAAGEETKPPVTVVLRQGNTFAMLANEQLYAKLFPTLSTAFFQSYLTEHFGTAAGAMPYYEARLQQQELVAFSYLGQQGEVEMQSFLLTPLRGMLALVVLVGLFACCLYYLSDREAGVLDAVPLTARFWRLLLYVLSGGCSLAVFALLAVLLCGLWEGVAVEIGVMLLYLLAASGFAMLLTGLLPRAMDLAAALPAVAILTLAACPIFLNMEIPVLSALLPTYWYLHALHGSAGILGLLCYTPLAGGAAYLVLRIRRR